MYGKHCRLQVANIVLLVSKSGFFAPAGKKAKVFGYRTIHPNISQGTLTQKLGIAGDLRMGMKPMYFEFPNIRVNMLGAGIWDDDEHFRRADGSELIKQIEYLIVALQESFKEEHYSLASFLASSGEVEKRITVDGPLFEAEPLHVRVKNAYGHQFINRVNSVTFTAKGRISEIVDLGQTEYCEFGGVQFGTGRTVFEDKPGRLVAAGDDDGNFTASLKLEYEVKSL